MIVQEEHFFRDADSFRQEAPSFFPFIGDGRTWSQVGDEGEAAKGLPGGPKEGV